MSKSDPDSAVFMEDTVEDVTRKIMAAYCPSKPEAAAATATDVADAGKESMLLVKVCACVSVCVRVRMCARACVFIHRVRED